MKLQEPMDAFAKTGNADTLKSGMFDARGNLNDMYSAILTDPQSPANTTIMQDNWKDAMKIIEAQQRKPETSATGGLVHMIRSGQGGYGLTGAAAKHIGGIPLAIAESLGSRLGLATHYQNFARSLADPRYAKDISRAMRLVKSGEGTAQAQRILAQVMLRAKLDEVDERAGSAAPIRSPMEPMQ